MVWCQEFLAELDNLLPVGSWPVNFVAPGTLFEFLKTEIYKEGDSSFCFLGGDGEKYFVARRATRRRKTRRKFEVGYNFLELWFDAFSVHKIRNFLGPLKKASIPSQQGSILETGNSNEFVVFKTRKVFSVISDNTKPTS